MILSVDDGCGAGGAGGAGGFPASFSVHMAATKLCLMTEAMKFHPKNGRC